MFLLSYQEIIITCLVFLSKWEIVRCDDCGSSGVHLGCAGLKSDYDPWQCDECRALTGQMAEMEEESESEDSESESDDAGPSRKRIKLSGM